MDTKFQDIAMKQAAEQALDTLKALGWKVIAFHPKLVAGVDPKVLETASVEAYWQVLEDLGRDEEAAIALD